MLSDEIVAHVRDAMSCTREKITQNVAHPLLNIEEMADRLPPADRDFLLACVQDIRKGIARGEACGIVLR